MLTTAAGSVPDRRRESIRPSSALVSRKIWLPRLLYEALPWFYLLAGFAALAATLYISQWFWVLPHYLLFSAVCIHLGLSVYRRRQRARKRRIDA